MLNVLQVVHPGFSEDEGVIQIHRHKRIGEMPQDIFHHPHEICKGFFQAKGNDKPFKKALFGLEGSLPYIGLLYCDLVVARLQINLTEVFGPIELVKEIINLGNWVLVSECDFI
jgi:hypothetical protein